MNIIKIIYESKRLLIYLLTILLFSFGLILANVEIISYKYSGLATLLLLFFGSVPVYYGLSKILPNKKNFYVVVVLSILACLIEYVGLTTGFPYGDFYYSKLAGPKLVDTLPISVAFAWPPLVIGSYFLFHKEERLLQDIRPVLFLVAMDMVIDPAAVELGLWGWLEGGLYYNVPLINYFGWLVSSIMGIWVIDKLVKQKPNQINPWIFFSLFVNLVFWSGFLLGSKMFIPVFLAVFLFYQLHKKIDFDF